jgi:hypothetical protein
MKPGLSDTSDEIERIQTTLIRGLSVAERISMSRSLSQTAIQLARRAIRRANPHLSEREVELLYVALHYGEGLASALRARLSHQEK